MQPSPPEEVCECAELDIRTRHEAGSALGCPSFGQLTKEEQDNHKDVKIKILQQYSVNHKELKTSLYYDTITKQEQDQNRSFDLPEVYGAGRTDFRWSNNELSITG